MICLLIRWSQDGHAKKDSSKVWFNAAVYTRVLFYCFYIVRTGYSMIHCSTNDNF